MNKTKLISGMLILGLMLTGISCKNDKNEYEKTRIEEVESKEYSSAFICPMHCKGSEVIQLENVQTVK